MPSPATVPAVPDPAPEDPNGPLQEGFPVRVDIAERARRLGPLPFSALGLLPPPDLPEAPALAGWAADSLDRIWYDEGRPDPFIYVEVGAGDGAHARELLRLGPECLDALRVVLVEDDGLLRKRHTEDLSIESPAFILGPVVASEDPDEEGRPLPGIGPLVTSLAEVPALWSGSVGVVVAYGWLSRQPADRYMWKDATWWEVRLGSLPEAGEHLSEMTLPVVPERAALLEESIGRRFEGARYCLPVGASAWLQSVLGVAERGWLIAVDRWDEKVEPLRQEAPRVALRQLAVIRRPSEGPAPVTGSVEAVLWRLG